MASHSHPSASIHFFKIILKTNLQSIKIPKKFIGRYGSDLPNLVFLKPPDGKEWKVHLTKHDNEVWFQEGWKEFSCFYSLDEGHLILFKYEETTSQFDVRVFDKSALEIDYPSSPKNNLSDDEIEISNYNPPNQKDRHKTPLSSSRPHKKMRGMRNSRVVSDLKKSTNAELKIPKEPEEDTGARTFTKSTCLNSEHRRKRALTTVEKIRAINSAKSFKSENPFFMVIMQPSNVSKKCYLVMPTKFAKTHLKKECGVVQLEALDGRTWSARYEIPTIRDGWKKFVMENCLKEGQVCVFEMIGGLFKVHIFGDKEEVKRTKKTYNFAEDLKVSPFEKEKILLGKASSFTSESDHFMVKMTHAYIHGNSKLHVPKQFARKHLHVCTDHSIKLIVQDVAWPVECLFRLTPLGNELHEFSSGRWRQFRKDNDLKVGDICVFEVVPNIKLTLKVTILRAAKGHLV